MNDSEIIEHLQSGNRNKALKVLYKEFPKVKANILRSGGTKAIAEEIFQDSLLLLVEKVEQPGFKLTSKLSSFLYGIARFLWMNELRKQQKSQELEWKDTLIVSATDLGYDEEKEARMLELERVLDQINERCQKIFRLFYYEGHSMKIIAEKLGFSNTNSAKTQKYKCLERAMELASQTPKTALS